MPWFQDALRGRDAPHRDFYVWAEPKPDGSPPNNWQSSFGGPAWQFDETSGQSYLHIFLPTQPDLNWWNEEVREAFDDILRFWFERGVAGFRIDVTHGIVNDRELRDDPVATPDDHPRVQRHGSSSSTRSTDPRSTTCCAAGAPSPTRPSRRRSSSARPTCSTSTSCSPSTARARTSCTWRSTSCSCTRSSRPTRCAPSSRRSRRSCRRRRGRSTPAPTTTPAGSPTRWAGGDPQRARVALMMLLTLRGTPFLYYGDEIGLPDVALDPADALDPVPQRTGDPTRNRDTCRTPMHWSAEPGAGFTDAGRRAVAAVRRHGDQRRRPARRPGLDAALRARPDRAAARRDRPDAGGAYASLPAPDGVWAYRRGDGHAVALNLSGAEATVEGLDGTVAIATDRARDGEPVDGRADAPAVAGRRRHAAVMLDDLLSEEGWAYASTPPVAEGDPGRYHALFGRDSLITALQVLPARPDVAAATLRALAALQGERDDPETDEQPGKILHEYRPQAPALARRARLAGARRRAALLRLGRLDVVVPGRARGARRRRAERRARARVARRRRVARAGARATAAALVRYGPRVGSGGLSQQGWRDVMGPAGEDARRRRHRAPRRLDAGGAARRRRRAGGRLRGAARARRFRARRRGRAAPRRSPARIATDFGPGVMALEGDDLAGAGPGLAARLAAVVGRARRRQRDAVAARLCEPDVLTAVRAAHARAARARSSTPRATTAARLAVRLVAGLGRAARRRARRRTPSACAPACSRRSTSSATRPSSTRSRATASSSRRG